MKKILLSFDAELLARIDAARAKLKWNRSQYVREMLKKLLDKGK